jgi:hypothetical protein
MALGRPIVQFDLAEGRTSAGPASLYAAPNDPVSLADEICRLLDDESLREDMGARGRERYRTELAWTRQVPHLLAAYERALAKRRRDINLLRLSWWRRWRHKAPPAAPEKPVAAADTATWRG